VEDRRRHEERLVREYHRALVPAGWATYPFDECFSDYRRYAYAGYLMAVRRLDDGGAHGARGTRCFPPWPVANAAQIIDLESHDLIDSE